MAGGRLKLTPSLARQFLEALYGRFFSRVKSEAFLEVRGKREGEELGFRRFYPSVAALVQDMAKWPPNQNYWVGVALRKDNQGGKKENCKALTALFNDVDCGAAGHKKAPRYKDKAEALAAIETFPLRPTMVIDSGGGYQPYWLLKEPVGLLDGNFALVERTGRGIALALGGDVGATDAARILRVAGTYNMKIPGNPRPVKLVWCEPERVYDLADFAEYEAKGKAQAYEAPRGEGAARPRGAGGEYEGYAQRALADEIAKLARTPEGSHNRNIQLNQSAFALGQLVGAGVLDQGGIEAALYGVAVSIGLGEVEAKATIESGLEAGIKDPRRLPEQQAATKGQAKRKAGGQEQGDPQGQGEGEPDRIPWVGHSYCVDKGWLSLAVYNGKNWQYKPLANFQARIQEEVTQDDGLRTFKEFHITGSLDTGRPLPMVRIPAKEYDSLNWITREWGAAAAMAPGRSLGAHLSNAIQAHSQGFKNRTVFAHTGWRKINGVWRYLHGGGAIGPGDPIDVDLGENLHLYRLPAPGGVEAARASLRFLDLAPWEITAPLLACAYLAPFANLLKIDFSLWIYGETGSLKSTLVALALSHYGDFNRLTLPGSWLSTANSLEKLTFALKDTLCVIDDFNPSANHKEAHEMIMKARRIIYQAGNLSGRGRLAPDLSARPDFYPRCLIISTGEMLLPGQRQSATARYLGLECDKGKTPIDKARVTSAQREKGLYAQAMAAYLEYLAPRLDDTQAEMRDLREGYREAFQSTAHPRIPEIQASLAVGFEYFLRFQSRMGVISEAQAEAMLDRAWRVFETLGEKHSQIIEGERPTLKFMAVLTELFYQARIYVESATVAGAPPQTKEELGWQGIEPARNAEFVGWADDETLFLMPEMTFKVVNETIQRQGGYFPLGKNELLAALARDDFIAPGKDGNTQLRWIQGATRRVIRLPLRKLFHDEAMGDEKK